ncbi:MAG: hypothetical protein HOV70_10920 [Streptomyces sp.]|nr:hypothetical protein [Streptomyces sp.]
MALPDGVPTITVKDTRTHPDGPGHRGRFTLTPDAPTVTLTNHGQIIMGAANALWDEETDEAAVTVVVADLTHKLTAQTPPAPLATLASCTGCPTVEEVSHYRLIRGMAMQRQEHEPAAADAKARAWAQSHAETCRAIPKPPEPPVTPPQ